MFGCREEAMGKASSIKEVGLNGSSSGYCPSFTDLLLPVCSAQEALTATTQSSVPPRSGYRS